MLTINDLFPMHQKKGIENQEIAEAFITYLAGENFPCIGARAAVAREQISCFVADHLACPNDDSAIINFIYHFVDQYRQSRELFHSAAVIFKQPRNISEEQFDRMMWWRLQALADIDANYYRYDGRVSADPASTRFSFSLKEEAFFIIGLNRGSNRQARQFSFPALIFNPHAQFEQLRASGKYETMKKVIRKREIAHSGSVNPMLRDFGEDSEVYQYSGRQYDPGWHCPLKIKHEAGNHHSTP
jgi:uncharacterized protein